MKTKPVRLTVEELHELKWLTGGLLALLAVWSLSALDMGLEFHVLLAGSLIGVALLRPGWVVAIPNRVWYWAGPAMFVLVLADFILSIPQVLPPLVRMVMFLLVYRVLAHRKRREDLQLVLICLFCLVISGALTVSLLFVLQILLFAPVAMAFLFVICLLDQGAHKTDHTLSWQHFSWGRLFGRIGRVLDVRVLALGGLLYCFIMLVSSFLFVLIPRFNLEQAIPFLQLGVNARSGFSESVRLGEVSEISEDNSVALRVDVPSLEAMDSSPYWRMLVLDQYEDGGFRMSSGLQINKFRKRETVREIHGQRRLRNVSEGTARWTFYLEGGVSRYLPIPGPFRRMRFQTIQELDMIEEVHVFGTDIVRQSVFFYQVEGLDWLRRMPASSLETQTFASLRAGLADAKLQYPVTTLDLELEAQDLAWLGALNARVTGGKGNLDAARYSQLITNYLWQNFSYSLRPNGMKEQGDPVLNWLREGSRGHCELFASAHILLARQAGYPTRMVVGFVGGSWNPVEEYFVVRNRDAHAWVEIFDARTNEWLRVDPTPGNGSSDPEVALRGGVEFAAGWGAWVDSLRIQWYRRIVDFDEQDQVDLAMGAKEVFRELKQALAERFSRLVERIKALIQQPFEGLSVLYMLFVVLMGVGSLLFWRCRFAWLRWLAALLRRPEALDPVRQQAGRYLKRLKQKQVQADVAELPESVTAMRAQLESVRFGPRVQASEARVVFKAARRVLRGI